jgi:hypothetical protein
VQLHLPPRLLLVVQLLLHFPLALPLLPLLLPLLPLLAADRGI